MNVTLKYKTVVPKIVIFFNITLSCVAFRWKTSEKCLQAFTSYEDPVLNLTMFISVAVVYKY